MPFRRVPLSHDVPLSVCSENALFFITICCNDRNRHSLCHPEIGERILDSVRFLNARGLWRACVFLLMPDHVHGLIRFPPGAPMRRRIADWKRWTSQQLGIEWQRNFFDRRLRSDESAHDKAEYILANPVRAGLVDHTEAWPYRIVAEDW